MSLADLAGPIIGAGANIFGANEQAKATEHAADIQKQLSEEALAYQKEQDKYRRQTEANRYGMVMAGLSPYASAGSNANTALSGFLGLPTPSTSSTPTPMTSNLVTMRAPDGSTKQVPASEMQHWIDKGATLSGTGDDQQGQAQPKPSQPSVGDILAHYNAPRPMPAMR